MTTTCSFRLDDTGQPNAKTFTQQGHRLYRRGDPSSAIAAYHRALAAQPTYGPAHQALGFVWLQKQHYAQAVLHFVKALALQPESARLHVGYGMALCGIDQYEQAIEHYRHALYLKPDAPGATYQLAQALRRLNRVEESLPYYEQALRQRPEHMAIRYNYAAALLTLGRFQEGFRQYERRWRRVQPHGAAPQWQGEDLTGKSILLYREQGYGDTIQFARHVPEVTRRGGQVILQCQQPLVRLLRTLEGVTQVEAKAEAIAPIDYQVSVMSLAYATQSTLATVPAQVPYLKVPKNAFKPLPAARTKRPFKVGVVWAAGQVTTNGGERSMALRLFAVLFDCPGVTFYSLQKGEQAAEFQPCSDLAGVIDLAPQLEDFADAAAYIAQLDLVISVDTAVAHLTGALDKEVWILLPYAADWRWMLQREDSPWYPTARLFRQRHRGDWKGVIDRVKQQLAGRFSASQD
ncbi:tetratricopeptide repeat protein [Candidatus Entotheonella palauensis]|uniref:tetratricopeptide repeat protein n=1 Tax=Candidatus Entotheonella palauensis TaxID=93172 RepID=UPI000B7CCBFB|nr:tetratricopeptide repeat protein [Candidatus Entotheonella palauensis]